MYTTWFTSNQTDYPVASLFCHMMALKVARLLHNVLLTYQDCSHAIEGEALTGFIAHDVVNLRGPSTPALGSNGGSRVFLRRAPYHMLHKMRQTLKNSSNLFQNLPAHPKCSVRAPGYREAGLHGVELLPLGSKLSSRTLEETPCCLTCLLVVHARPISVWCMKANQSEQP